MVVLFVNTFEYYGHFLPQKYIIFDTFVKQIILNRPSTIFRSYGAGPSTIFRSYRAGK